MQPRHLILAAVPLLGLAAASWVSAGTIRTIHSVLEVSGLSNGEQVFDCNLTSSGVRYHMQAEARGLDSCGNPTNGGGNPTPRAVSAGAGTTQSIQFDDVAASGPCGATTQHKATVQSHIIDPTIGQEFTVNHTSSSNSGCWNCQVSTGGFTRNSSLTGSGSCTNRTFKAHSSGTTP